MLIFKHLALSTTIFALTFNPFNLLLAQETDSLRNYYQQVVESYQQDLEEARQEGKSWQEVDTLLGAGIAYQYLGKFEEAIKLFEEGLEIARQIPDRGREESAIRKLATVHKKIGAFQGINFLEEQLQNTTDQESRRIILANLSLGHLSNGEYQKAINVYEQYLDLVRVLQNQKAEAEALRDLAGAYAALGKYGQAIPLLEEGVAIAQQLNDTSLLNWLLTQLGSAYRFAGNNQKALDTLQEALQLAKEAEETSLEWITLRTLAQLYTALDNLPQVIKIQQERLAISRNTNNIFWEALTLEDLSGAYFWLKDYSQAIELQKQALSLYQSFNQQSQQTTSSTEAQALEKLGFLLWRAGKLKEAETTLYSALKSFDLQRQEILGNANFLSLSSQELSLFAYEASSDIYRILQQILVAENRTNEALEVSEKGRARAYIDLLVSRLGADPTSATALEAPNLEQIKQIAKKENTTLVQYTVLYEYSRLYRYRFGIEQPYAQASGLLIWVVKPTGEVTLKQVQLQENLADVVQKARQSILLGGRRTRRQPPGKRSQEKLYQILIEPIANLLPTNPEERVTFIPQDTLFLVPFPALQDPDGNYLIEQHTILTAPSIQVLGLARKVKKDLSSSQPALVIGNPTMPGIRLAPNAPRQQLSELPGSEEEAKQIAQLLHTQPLIGDAATKAAVVARMEKTRLMHFATHGLLDNVGGSLSSLALAPSKDDEGFLTAREILQMKLQAELAVLSACNTGRGRITGDGVVGLSRSFVSAGVPSVVVSLWAIPDEPTAKLMREFYQNIEGDVDKATALRQAMIITKQEFPDPVSWAAFTLIGLAD